jgi:arginyl-tRNA--protein-N-Asp/Glu arginylyltransferase
MHAYRMSVWDYQGVRAAVAHTTGVTVPCAQHSNWWAACVCMLTAGSSVPAATAELLDQGWRRSGTFLYKARVRRVACDPLWPPPCQHMHMPGLSVHCLPTQHTSPQQHTPHTRTHHFNKQPDNRATCCRQYTIRLDVSQFAPSKGQAKLLRKWDAFLAGEAVRGGVAAVHPTTGPAEALMVGSVPRAP